MDDVNDNSPQLLASSLSAATRENTPVNSLIHRVNAKDSDEGKDFETLNYQFSKSCQVVIKLFTYAQNRCSQRAEP